MKIKLAFFCECAILFAASEGKTSNSKMNTYTTREHSWKEFFNEVTEHCNYWELGFGAIDAEYESEVVRQAYVNGLDVDEACDQWRDAIQEIALGG